MYAFCAEPQLRLVHILGCCTPRFRKERHCLPPFLPTSHFKWLRLLLGKYNDEDDFCLLPLRFSVRLCLTVSLFVRASKWLCVYARARTRVRGYLCLHVYLCVCVYVFIFAFALTFAQTSYVSMRQHTRRMLTYTDLCVYRHVRAHIRTSTRTGPAELNKSVGCRRRAKILAWMSVGRKERCASRRSHSYTNEEKKHATSDVPE